MITGLDLVQEQIRVAGGAKLGFAQIEIEFSGHAIECRIQRREPEDVCPVAGRRRCGARARRPWGARRFGALRGYRIPPYYDSLIGKLVVAAKSRTECLMRLKRALAEYVIEGVDTHDPAVPGAAHRARHHRRALRYSLA